MAALSGIVKILGTNCTLRYGQICIYNFSCGQVQHIIPRGTVIILLKIEMDLIQSKTNNQTKFDSGVHFASYVSVGKNTKSPHWSTITHMLRKIVPWNLSPCDSQQHSATTHKLVGQYTIFASTQRLPTVQSYFALNAM